MFLILLKPNLIKSLINLSHRESFTNSVVQPSFRQGYPPFSHILRYWNYNSNRIFIGILDTLAKINFQLYISFICSIARFRLVISGWKIYYIYVRTPIKSLSGDLYYSSISSWALHCIRWISLFTKNYYLM